MKPPHPASKSGLLEVLYTGERPKPHTAPSHFSYEIKIVNHAAQPVRLLSRRWEVTHADGQIDVIEGDGVLGEQPAIAPVTSHRYTSAHLVRPPGYATGHYTLQYSR
jgi:ApaG protein